MLEALRYEEFKANFHSCQTTPILSIKATILNHASKVYTHEIFKIFQAKKLKTWKCLMYNRGEEGSMINYCATQSGKKHDYTIYLTHRAMLLIVVARSLILWEFYVVML